MTKTELLLLQIQGAVLVMTVAAVITFKPPPVVRQIAPPVLVQVEVDPVDAGPDGAVEEPAWVALEKLEYMAGPWRTEDGELLVSVSNRSTAVPSDAPVESWIRGWRLVVEWDRGPALVCGLYANVQEANPPFVLLPWRLAYCLGRNIDPKGPAVATRVSLLREPGQEYLRLVLGSEIDVLIYQVE